jgi:hypothetical protein
VSVLCYTPLTGLRIEEYSSPDKGKIATAILRAQEIPLSHNPSFLGGREREDDYQAMVESWDGKFHRIHVGVKRPECRVLAQDGYFEPKPYNAL